MTKEKKSQHSLAVMGSPVAGRDLWLDRLWQDTGCDLAQPGLRSHGTAIRVSVGTDEGASMQLNLMRLTFADFGELDPTAWDASHSFSTPETSLESRGWFRRLADDLRAHNHPSYGQVGSEGEMAVAFSSELAFLRSIDGFIFVVDTKEVCFSSNRAYLRRIEQALVKSCLTQAAIPVLAVAIGGDPKQRYGLSPSDTGHWKQWCWARSRTLRPGIAAEALKALLHILSGDRRRDQ